MLPEPPFAGILHFINVIMCYPIRIVIKHRRVQVVGLKLIIGINNRLHMIFVLNDMKPSEHITPEVVKTGILRLMLNVKHGWKVSFDKTHIVQKEICLIARRRLVAPKMIRAPYEAMLTRLTEIILKLRVYTACAFSGLDKDETHRALLYHGITQQFPVYVSLVMAYVDSSYLIAFGIFGVTIQRAPAKSERTDKEIIEHPYIQRHNSRAACPPCPSGIFAEKLIKKRKTMTGTPLAAASST